MHQYWVERQDCALDLALDSKQQAYLDVLLDINIWAQEFVNWTAYDYQEKIVQEGATARLMVLRMGRRLGKSEILSILALWHGFTQINKKPGGDQYDVLIITPHKAQVQEIFDRISDHIERSPVLQASIKKSVKLRVEFKNGSVIKGMTAATRSNTGASGTRGQRADVLILDEVDYFLDSDLTNIINIRNEDPGRIKIFAASTPSGKRGMFFKWCTGSPNNGWRHFHMPSIVNKKLLEVNPDTGQSYLADLRDELPEARFLQEVMAEFGEELQGVFQKRFLDVAVSKGKARNLKYADEHVPLPKPYMGIRVLGVDWDKYGAGTNMVAVDYDPNERLFIPFLRVEIPRSETTYTEAVQKIIDLNEIFDFNHIYIDAGAAEKQVEDLHLYGKRNPKSGLHKKVKRIHFASKIDVRDPYTKKKTKQPLKPYMVDCATLAFEAERVLLNPEDKKIIRQLENYRVKSINANGVPIFEDKDEHIVDAFCMCILAVVLATDPLVIKKGSNAMALVPRMHEALFPVLQDAASGAPAYGVKGMRPARPRGAAGIRSISRGYTGARRW